MSRSPAFRLLCSGLQSFGVGPGAESRLLGGSRENAANGVINSRATFDSLYATFLSQHSKSGA